MFSYIKKGFIVITLAWLSIFILMINSGCAKLVAPTGGPRDTIPPKVILENSTPNLMTNFQEKQIILTFDEWVQLNKPTTEIIVSPPLEKIINIKLKGKKVVIDLSEETLRTDATYVINFGKAIQDYTEKNTPQDFRFVFSTGDYLDSLEVKGQVTDITTKKPVKDVLVMFYDNLSDTVVRTEKPFYFARTDKNGQYRIPYMKSDTFKMLALVDENFNYLYDTETESIGFQFENIILTDSFKKSIDLQLFQPQLPLRRQSTNNKIYGHLAIAYNQTLSDTLRLQTTPSFVTDYYEQEKDTLHFWYSDTTSLRTFVITDEKDYVDTFEINVKSEGDFFKKNKHTHLQNPNSKQAKGTIKHHPLQPIELTFQHPFYGFDTTRMVITEDSVKRRIYPSFSRFDNSRKNLSIHYPWKSEMTYEMTFFPNALTDIFELTNDTILLKYRMNDASNYGNVEVIIEGMSEDTSYVVQLMDSKKSVVGTFTMDKKKNKRQFFKALPTGKYYIHIIEDINGNGRWDTGEYPTRQPERVFVTKEEELRPNWDLELKYQRNSPVGLPPQTENK